MCSCMCIECVEDQSEPIERQSDDGKWVITYKTDILTDAYNTAVEAWVEFYELGDYLDDNQGD